MSVRSAVAISLMLVVAGCKSNDTTQTTDMGTIATDMGVTDVDMGVDASAAPGYPSYGAALAAYTNARCACGYAAQGFSNAADCSAQSIDAAPVLACEITAARILGPTGTSYYSCIAGVYQAAADCVASSTDCDESGACYHTLSNSLVNGCETLTTEQNNQFLAAENMCATTTSIVGSGADTCGAASEQTSSAISGNPVFTANTVGAGDHRTGPSDCTNSTGGGADVTFKWVVPASGMYTIDTIGSAVDDTVLYLVDSACPTSFTLTNGASGVLCNDDANYSDNIYDSSITANFTGGAEVYIVVDGYGPINTGFVRVNINPVEIDAGTPMDGGTTMDAGSAATGDAG